MTHTLALLLRQGDTHTLALLLRQGDTHTLALLLGQDEREGAGTSGGFFAALDCAEARAFDAA